jgi:hypothetical protein
MNSLERTRPHWKLQFKSTFKHIVVIWTFFHNKIKDLRIMKWHYIVLVSVVLHAICHSHNKFILCYDITEYYQCVCDTIVNYSSTCSKSTSEVLNAFHDHHYAIWALVFELSSSCQIKFKNHCACVITPFQRLPDFITIIVMCEDWCVQDRNEFVAYLLFDV